MLLLLMLAMGSCSKSFTIKGRITGMGDQNVRITVCASSNQIVDEWVRAKDGSFEWQGQAPQLALVVVTDNSGVPLAIVPIENGDKVELNGDMMQRSAITLRGNDLSEQWNQWIEEHRAAYDMNDRTTVNNAIAKYATEHRDDVFAALLLLVDYHPTSPQQQAQFKQLLGRLSPKAKPEGLLNAYQRLQQATCAKAATSLNSLLLWRHGQGMSSLTPATAPATLVWAWMVNASHQSELQPVKQLAKAYGKRLQVADVLMQPDTVAWTSHLRADATTWDGHYWAPDGPMNADLMQLNIEQLPHYVVADSLGRIHYNGPDIEQARTHLKQILK